MQLWYQYFFFKPFRSCFQWRRNNSRCLWRNCPTHC